MEQEQVFIAMDCFGEFKACIEGLIGLKSLRHGDSGAPRLRPDGGQRRGDDLLAQLEGPRTSVQDGRAQQAFAQLVAEPCQVTNVRGGWGARCLDLERNEVAAAVFDDHVHLVPSFLLPQME